MSKPFVLIERWAVVENVSSQSFEQLQPGNRLVGYVTGHERLTNAKLVYTSPIVSVDRTLGTVETRNTMYQLGEPNIDYKSWEQRQRNSAAA
jgi:hypothetical protein